MSATRRLPQSLVGVCVLALLAAAPLGSTVADAAMRGDVAALRLLLQEGADVNEAHGDGMTALHWAAERASAEMATMLVYAGANVDAVTRIGHYTPLHLASSSGSAETVRILLDAGADVGATTTNSGVTSLHLAAAAGSADIINALVARGADVNAREAEWGQTPLMFAASRNRAAAVAALLERGADADITTRTVDLLQQFEIDEAAKDRQAEVLAAFSAGGERTPTPREVQAAVLAGREFFLAGDLPEEKGEPDELEQFRRPANIEAKGGLTALLHAARQGHHEAAVALLDGGADVNLSSSGDHTSPLLMAVINGQFDMAMLLIERGADPDLAARINGATPLFAAVNAQWQPRTRFPQPQEMGLQTASYLDVMRALLEAGADPDARLSMHPWYMVYTGCGNGNCGLVDTNGATAFWRAAYATDVEAMRLLVEHGADPNIPTKAPPPRRRRAGGGAATPARNELLVEVKDRPELARPKPQAATLINPYTGDAIDEDAPDPSGLPPIAPGGPGVFPLHAASGVGYGEGFAGNAHRHAPDAWLRTVKFLIEELGVDVNLRDHNGYNAVHHAAARGDNEMILYLIGRGADVMAVSRRGQTTVDLANGPVQRVSPFPETVALLESLGAKNNHNCVTC